MNSPSIRAKAFISTHRSSVQSASHLVFLAKFIGHAIPALGVNPINIVGRACNSARSAFDAILIGNRCDFELLLPLIHIGGTEKITIFGDAIQACLRIFNDEVGFIVAFVTNGKQLI